MPLHENLAIAHGTTLVLNLDHLKCIRVATVPSAICATCRHSARKQKSDFVTVRERVPFALHYISDDVVIEMPQSAYGTWCVCATPSYGPSTYIGDFKSEVEAQNWIIHKAKDHFPRRDRSVLESC
jgi:hypothetical protein